MATQNILSQLQSLGMVAQVSHFEELDVHLNTGMRTVYSGFDPTSDSLQVGNLVPLLALRRFQLAGHRPILLVGGATGLIGDPGGRTTERQLNEEGVVQGYVERIKQQAMRFLDFDCGANSALVVNNIDWTRGVDVIDFLRNIGKHFSVNAMIQKESVKRRLAEDGAGISYTEFSYMILQAHDFVQLNQRFDCTLQIGGSDQWGNITSGLELLRRWHHRQAFALTFPLITKADGTKFGKSAGESIWLDARKTSPYSFYQFWLNTSDEDALPFLRTFTLESPEELNAVELQHRGDPGARLAQKRLAARVTELVHGAAGLASALRISDALFSGVLDALAEADLAQLAQDGLPCVVVGAPERALLDLLVDCRLAVTPRGEVTIGQARKFVLGSAISVNGTKTTEPTLVLTRETALFGRFHVLQRGRKHHALVEWKSE